MEYAQVGSVYCFLISVLCCYQNKVVNDVMSSAAHSNGLYVGRHVVYIKVLK